MMIFSTAATTVLCSPDDDQVRLLDLPLLASGAREKTGRQCIQMPRVIHNARGPELADSPRVAGRTLPALLAAGATTVVTDRAAAITSAASLATVTPIGSANADGVVCELPTDVFELLRDRGVVA
jgi:hypothetical protein